MGSCTDWPQPWRRQFQPAINQVMQLIFANKTSWASVWGSPPKILWISVLLMKPSRGGIIVVALHTDNIWFCASYYGFPLLIAWTPLSIQKYQAQHYETAFLSCPANIQFFIHCSARSCFLLCLRYFSIPLGMDRSAADFIFLLVIVQSGDSSIKNKIRKQYSHKGSWFFHKLSLILV